MNKKILLLSLLCIVLVCTPFFAVFAEPGEEPEGEEIPIEEPEESLPEEEAEEPLPEEETEEPLPEEEAEEPLPEEETEELLPEEEMLQSDFALQALAADPYGTYPIAANSSLRGKIIILDPGHGQGSGGGYADFVEHSSNLNLAKLLKTNLENCGAQVILTRSSDTDVDNYVRMAMTNQLALRLLRFDALSKRAAAAGDSDQIKTLDALISKYIRLENIMQSVIDDDSLADIYFNSPYDYTYTRVIQKDLLAIFQAEEAPLIHENLLFLSIHSNAPGSSDTTISGNITYYLDNATSSSANYYRQYYNVERNEFFATVLGEKISEAAGWKNYGIRTNDYFMLRELNIPAALAEIGYMTNTSDRTKLQDPTYQKRIVNALTDAIITYFEEYASSETTPLKKSSLLSSGTYVLNKGTVSGIEPGTSAAALKDGIKCPEGYSLAVTDTQGGHPGRNEVVSGDLLVVKNDQGKVVEGHTVIIYGDVNGNGEVDLIDLMRVQKYLLGVYELDGTTIISADVSKDDNVALLDLLRIQKHLLGTAEIAQK